MVSEDRFYEESREGVAAVLDRMWQVIGKPICGYAEGLDVNENTVKTWRRRGEVSIKYLKGFAAKHNVSLDYLLHGDAAPAEEEARVVALTADQARAGYAVEVLSKEEQALLDNYRHCPPQVRQAVKELSISLAQPAKKGRAA